MSLQSLTAMFRDSKSDSQESKCAVCDKPGPTDIEIDGTYICSEECQQEEDKHCMNCGDGTVKEGREPTCCCLRCWDQWKKRKEALECRNCDKKITELVKEQFCSVDCYNEYYKPCPACGEEGAELNAPEICGQRCIEQLKKRKEALECRNCDKKITELVKEHYCSLECYTEYAKPCMNCGDEGAAPIDNDDTLFCSSSCYDQWTEKRRAEQEEKRDDKMITDNLFVPTSVEQVTVELVGEWIQYYHCNSVVTFDLDEEDNFINDGLNTLDMELAHQLSSKGMDSGTGERIFQAFRTKLIALLEARQAMPTSVEGVTDDLVSKWLKCFSLDRTQEIKLEVDEEGNFVDATLDRLYGAFIDQLSCSKSIGDRILAKFREKLRDQLTPAPIQEQRVPELLAGLKRKAATPEPEDEDEKREERTQKRGKKQRCSKCQREIHCGTIESLETNEVFCSAECALPPIGNHFLRCLNCNKPCGISQGKQACNAKCAAEYDKKKQQNLRRSKRDRTNSSSSDVLLDRFMSVLEEKLAKVEKKFRLDAHNGLLGRFNTLATVDEKQHFIANIDKYLDAKIKFVHDFFEQLGKIKTHAARMEFMQKVYSSIP